jgi:hypothetical protein
MKSKIDKGILFASIILLSVILSGSADEFKSVSVNAIGYYRIPISRGQNVVSCPFNMVGGSNMTLEAMFNNTPLEQVSVIFVFETNPQEYVKYTYSDKGWMDENGEWCGDVPIPRGQAFWVDSPSDTAITVIGEVPSEPITKTPILHGLQMLASAYPTTSKLDKTVPSDGDIIYRYSATNNFQQYIPEFYIGGMGWMDQNGIVTEEKKLVGGDGLWYISASESNKFWKQEKPYLWP